MDEKATQLHAIASLKVLLDATKPHNGAATSTAANHIQAASAATAAAAAAKETVLTGQDMPNGIVNTLAQEARLEAVSEHFHVN